LGFVATFAALLLQPGATAQPSFDCARANGAVEAAICTDALLGNADKRMAQLYAAAQISAFGRGTSNQRAAQLEWMTRRNGCAQLKDDGKSEQLNDNPVRDCVLRSYRERNAALAIAVLLDQPELALASLRVDYPKMAPLYEALQLYMSKPVDQGWSMAAHRESYGRAQKLLTPYFNDLQSDPDKSYGWSVLSGESESAKDSLSSDSKMASTLSLLSVYIDNDDSAGGQPFPCAAIVRRPDMISAAAPYFGSTLDNFLMRPECEDSLPAQPRFNALHKALNGFWGPQCDEGTIRFATYRGYAQTVTSARIGLPAPAGRVKSIERKGLKPQLVGAALAELEDQYQRYTGLSKAQAAKRARYWLGQMVSGAGDCNYT
jgi:uncharacterized protein YecT (DUF1311 family)